MARNGRRSAAARVVEPPDEKHLEGRSVAVATRLDHRIGAVVLFGPPGAGKGTQARKIAERLAIPHVSTGDMVRAQVRAGTPLGAKVAAVIAQGVLIPDEYVNELVTERVKQPDCQRGFVLDGYPRTVGQAHALVKMLNGSGLPIMTFQIKIGYNELIPRITGRRSCPRCGTIYNVFLQPPRQDNLCDRDQTPLETRSDDREAVIRERLLAYEEQTHPVIEFFCQAGHRIYEVDGTLGTEEISSRLVEILTSA